MHAGFFAKEMKQSELAPGSRGAPKAAGLAALCPSENFDFLGYHDHRLPEVATRAECALGLDPVGALTHLRLFGELLARNVAARMGLYEAGEDQQADRLRELSRQGLASNVLDMLHSLRKAGNRATHEGVGSQSEAFIQLKIAFQLAVWFQRSFGNDRKFNPGPFIPPPDLRAETEQLRTELEQLRAEAEAKHAEAEAARQAAQEQADRRLGAEEAARKAREERELWEALAQEAEAKRAHDQAAQARAQQALEELRRQYEAQLAALQAQVAQASFQDVQHVLEQINQAAAEVDLDEASTRSLVDAQLRAAGWEADSKSLRHADGSRPQEGRNLAIAEWPTTSGPADYVLFVGRQAVAVVEAKKQAKDVAGALEQAQRCSRDFRARDGAELCGGPWGEYRIPCLFATNGRPYLKQLETESGIWFLDARRPQNRSRALVGWCSPEGIKQRLAQDHDATTCQLDAEPTEYLELRDYQVAAIRAVEQAVARGERTCLVAMATGTGKTRTAIGLVYRLVKSQQFRRVLFLVDRTVLGEQTENAFQEVPLENLQTFADVFDMKRLGDVSADLDAKLHIATVQGMVRRVLDVPDPADAPTVDTYDCIVVDECHRGYGLDQEIGDAELKLAAYGIRTQQDYISRYRLVLEHFDAVKVGLTATPTAHTVEIFGKPTYQYTYREAVMDGFLVDHEPPLSLVTRLAEEGILWDTGAPMPRLVPNEYGADLAGLPDEVNVEIDAFNRRVVTERFNRVVCTELARHLDPNDDGKTLVFCATDSHADLVVELLKEAFQAQYGEVADDAVIKITGAADRPWHLIRNYQNERLPNVVVTVDLLTTGIDVPRISNLVFLRRVRSRILYEQMLGRATRLCPEIGKESFHIFDAVALYEALEPVTQMKPVVTNVNVSFRALVQELSLDDAEARQAALEQLVAKLQRQQQRMKGEVLDRFRAVTNLGPGDLARQLRRGGFSEAAAWFKEHSLILNILEEAMDSRLPFVSDHEDELRREEHG